MLMTGFEPGSSVIRSDRAVNCGTETAQKFVLFEKTKNILKARDTKHFNFFAQTNQKCTI